MAGFPKVPSRSDFGPKYVNVRPIQNPNRELDAGIFNLIVWQIAGCGRTAAQAMLLYDANIGLILRRLAFDPDDVLGPDAVTIDRAGSNFTFNFLGTYKDERGTETLFRPRAAIPFMQTGSSSNAGVAINGQSVVVQAFNGEDSNNIRFVLLVW